MDELSQLIQKKKLEREQEKQILANNTKYLTVGTKFEMLQEIQSSKRKEASEKVEEKPKKIAKIRENVEKQEKILSTDEIKKKLRSLNNPITYYF